MIFCLSFTSASIQSDYSKMGTRNIYEFINTTLLWICSLKDVAESESSSVSLKKIKPTRDYFPKTPKSRSEAKDQSMQDLASYSFVCPATQMLKHKRNNTPRKTRMLQNMMTFGKENEEEHRNVRNRLPSAIDCSH